MANPPPDKPDLPDYELEVDKSATQRAIDFARQRWVWVTLTIIVGLTALFTLGPNTYRELKARHAHGLLLQAASLMDSGDMEAASALIRRGVLMAPGDARVLAQLTLLNARGGDPASLTALRQKFADGTATPAEILTIAERAGAANQLETVRQALAGLPPDLPPALAARRALVSVNLATRADPAEAIRLAHEAARQIPDPENRRLRLVLAELLVKSQPPDIPAARAILDEIRASDDINSLLATRLMAFVHLADSRAFNLDATELSDRLATHPARTPDDTVLRLRLAAAASPTDESAAIDAFVTTLLNEPAPLKDRLAAARALVQAGAIDQALRLIPHDDAITSLDAFLIRLDALYTTKRADEVDQLFASASPPVLPEMIRQLLLARIATDANDTAAAEDAWTAVARFLPSSDPKHANMVATHAADSQRPDIAIAAYRVLAKHPQTRATGLQGLAQTLPTSTPIADALTIFQGLHEIDPANAETNAAITYLNLLANTNVEHFRQAARQGFAANPDSLLWLTAAVLAELRSNNPKGALALYDRLIILKDSPNNPLVTFAQGIDWSTAAPAIRAVRAATLFANNLPNHASPLQNSLNPDQLRPEEYALLKGR